ncbi:MAG: ATP-binding protein [Rhodothermales bacterium]
MANKIDVPDGRLYMGGSPDKGMEEPTFIKSSNLTTHGVIVGMTGSGKTGLGIILLEEILLSGLPTLILDPKGDMGNLLLTFPELSGQEFRPWISESAAKKDGVSADELAESTAGFWKKGLAGWGITPDRIAALRDKAEFSLYTPGSTAGIPLNIVGSLKAPKKAADIELMRDEIEGFVSSLLALVGVQGDPISSREHILLANLIEHSWQQGRDLDLPSLVGQIQDPPLRKLGVIDIDSFFPQKDRRGLALKINGLLASPSFATWLEGPALDIDKLLYTKDGKPKAAIMSMAHLSDEERQFVVTLVLSKMITWMRSQPGSDGLRALIYMDEVFGFVPPTKAPPSKKPILTILKQARAFGLGMVLSTQNPVDIDYKALSNTGTWMIGRLQTERDKARLMDGLTSSSGETDTKEIERLISGLQKRQFMLHSTKGSGPQLFNTRWAMSYLRGPMTRDEISELTADAPERVLPPEEASASSKPASSASSTSSSVAPDVASSTTSFYLHPASDWRAIKDIDPNSRNYAPAVAARVKLLYDDTKADLRHTEEWEAVIYPLNDRTSGEDAIPIDYDDRDLLRDAPDGATYEMPDAAIHTATFFKRLQKELKEYLYRERTVTVFSNKLLKLYSRIGESKEAFELRCHKAAEKMEDEAASKIRDKYEKRIKRTSDMLEKAEDKLEELRVDHSSRKTDELLSGVGSLLGMFLGGKKTSRGMAADLRRASSKRKQTRTTSQRMQSATNRVEEKTEELEDIENELADELLALDLVWEEKGQAIEELKIGLEKTDITIDEVALVWIPV